VLGGQRRNGKEPRSHHSSEAQPAAPRGNRGAGRRSLSSLGSLAGRATWRTFGRVLNSWILAGVTFWQAKRASLVTAYERVLERQVGNRSKSRPEGASRDMHLTAVQVGKEIVLQFFDGSDLYGEPAGDCAIPDLRRESADRPRGGRPCGRSRSPARLRPGRWPA
jgi:hypothetical protein